MHNHLVARQRLLRERTPFADIMLMVIWLMATPDSFRSVALRFGTRPSTLYFHYAYVVEALRELAPQYISWPDAAERTQIRTTFEDATGFPGIIGCIDCTHVYITAPMIDTAQYKNRHHSYSFNVQAVVDNDLLVRDLHVGEVGSMHDRRVFRRSPLCRSLLMDEDAIDAEEHILGDGAYPTTNFVSLP